MKSLLAVAAGAMLLAGCASNYPCCDQPCNPCAPKCCPQPCCPAPSCKGCCSCKSTCNSCKGE